MYIAADKITHIVGLAGISYTVGESANWCTNYDLGDFDIHTGVTLPPGFLLNCWTYSAGVWAIVSGREAEVAAQILRTNTVPTLTLADITVVPGIVSDGVTQVSLDVTIAAIAGASSYELRYKTATGEYLYTTVLEAGAVRLAGLLVETEYTISLRAYTIWGLTAWTAAVAVTTDVSSTPPDASAAFINITNAGPLFIKDSAGTVTPATITLNTEISGIEADPVAITYQWYSNATGSFVAIGGATAASYAVPSSALAALNQVIYKVIVTGTIAGVSGTREEQITVARLDSATNLPYARSTNERVTFAAPATGYAGIVYGPGAFTIECWIGSTPLTYNAAANTANSFSIAWSASGIGGTPSSASITPSGMSADSATITAVCTLRNANNQPLAATLTVVTSYSVTRASAVAGPTGAPGADGNDGTNGTNGVDGDDAVVYAMLTDVDYVVLSEANVYSPTTVTAYLWKTVGNAARVAHSGSFRIEYSIGGGWSSGWKTGTGTSITTISLPLGVTKVQFKAYSDASYTNQVDEVVVTVIPAGKDAITVLFPNSSHTVPATAAGVITNTDLVGSTAELQVMQGLTKLISVASGTAIATGDIGKFKITSSTQSVANMVTVPTYSRTTSETSYDTITIGNLTVNAATTAATKVFTITHEITYTTLKGVLGYTSAVQTITKSLGGAAGADGTDGSDGTNGTNGKTYILNITGGVRGFIFNTAGTTPAPAATAFACTLTEDGVAKTPATYTWSTGGTTTGLISGSGSAATFTPTVASTWDSAKGNNYVKLSVTYAGQTIETSIAIAVAKAMPAYIEETRIYDTSMESCYIVGNDIAGSTVHSGSFTAAPQILLTAACAAAATTLTVGATTAFSTAGTGKFVDGSANNGDVFTWTGKGANTLTGCSGVLAHPVNATIVQTNAKRVVISNIDNDIKVFNASGAQVISLGEDSADAALVIDGGAGGGIFVNTTYGEAVFGQATIGTGISGNATSTGTGVYGSSVNGYGVTADSDNEALGAPFKIVANTRSAAPTHTAERGSFWVSSTGALYYTKGGGVWVNLVA